MFREYFSKATVTLFLLTTITACGGGGGSDGSNNNTGGTINSAPTANAGADQTVEEHADVTLSGSGTDSDGSISSYSWTQTAGTSVTLTDAESAIVSFTAPEVITDETLTFQLTVTDNTGGVSKDSVVIKVNNFFDKNIILRVVRVPEDWMPFASTDGWTNAVKAGYKETESVKYFEAAIWEETDSIHLYAFDNEFDPLYGLASGITDEQKIEYREAYRVLMFEGMPEASSSRRSAFVRDSFIEISNYIVNQFPDADHHLMYSGHGAPGGRLFEAQLAVDDVAIFLDSWTSNLGRNLGVIDMGGPCNKGSLADLKSFCQYSDYYIASDLPNGGYSFDDWTGDKYYETNSELQYHQLMANSSNLKEVLTKRIDLKRKGYEYSVNNMTENKIEQGNYLYSCSSYHDFNVSFEEFVYGKSDYSIRHDLLSYLEYHNASEELIGKFYKMILYSADNRDFFEWEVESNGLLMDYPN